MKRLLYILMLYGFTLSVQAQVSTAYKTEVETIFQVNRSYVTTGLLADYGIFYTNVEKFNGVRSDSSRLEYTEWQSVFNSLYTYRFNSTANIPEPATVFEQVSTAASQDPSTIVLAGLHYRYERFKSNAVSSNLVYISNNKIYDRAGRPTTPYEVLETFALVPYRTVLEGSFHKFVFKPQLFYSNTGKTISSVQGDFNDGAGFRTLTPNTALTITYTSNGERNLIFKVTYTDGTSKESHTKVSVTGAAIATQARYQGIDTIQRFFPLRNFAAPKPYQNVVGKALVTVEFADPGQVIRRPLIVVEGFDPWKVLTPDNAASNFAFNDLIRDAGPNGLNVVVTGGQTLNDLLDNADYDLIFIDFDKGTDHIQRNAYLVENVIQWVNSVKQPYNGVVQKNVVVGFSMGGLVARYALRDMEVTGLTHDTRLYASFDSPHQGANVPVGFQAAVLHLAGSGIAVGLPNITVMPDKFTFGSIVSPLGRARNLLNTPAARQMLRYQVVGGGDLLIYDNAQHTSFMNEYRQLGYPSQGGIRNVVIANGSECGVDQGFLPGASFINVNEKFKLPWWGTLLGNILSPLALLTNYPQLAIGAPFTTRTDIKYEFKVNSLPSQAVQEVYKFKLTVKKKILFLITINIVLINKSFSSTSALLALDNPAGGIYDLGAFGSLPVQPLLLRFCFVPTFSALDIGNGAQTILPADLSKAYSPAYPPTSPKNVVAANFMTNPTEGGRTNQVHTQITARNGQWLFTEIQGTPAYFSCSYACPSLVGSISGPALVCQTGTPYTLAALPSGVTISWSQSANMAGVSGQGTTNYSVRGTGVGFGTVTATLSGTCGAAPALTKGVSVSNGLPPNTLDVYEDCYEQVFETDYADGASVYTWSVNNTLTGATTMYTNRPYKLKTAFPEGSYRINVGSACSGSAAISSPFFVDCGSQHFVVSPNPAKDVLSVTQLTEGTMSLRKDGQDFSATLIDESGNTVCKTKDSADGRIEFNTEALRVGHYILQIQNGDRISSHHIIIRR